MGSQLARLFFSHTSLHFESRLDSLFKPRLVCVLTHSKALGRRFDPKAVTGLVNIID